MGRIVAIAGGNLESTHKINQYIVALAGREKANLLFIGTASHDAVEYIEVIQKSIQMRKLTSCLIKPILFMSAGAIRHLWSMPGGNMDLTPN